MGKRGDELDGRSDLYSLGIVMYQMLTGDLPFKADTTMEMLLAHLQTPPTPIHTLHPELQIPDAVADLVMRTLEKDREKRPAGAADFITALEHAEREMAAPGETRVIRPTVVAAPPPTPARPAARAEQPPIAPSAGVAAPPRAAAARPAAPPAQPAAVAAPAARPVPRTAAPKKTSFAAPVIIAASLVLGVGIAAGAWFFWLKPPAVQESVTPASTTTPSSPPTEPAQRETKVPAQPVSPAPEPTGDNRPTSSAASETAKPPVPVRADVSRAAGAISRPAAGQPSKPARPTVDAAAVKQALTLGDFHFNRGEYADAIAEYERGLAADPGNAELRNAVQRARVAKQAEDRVLQ